MAFSDCDKRECLFQWKIENISHCCLETGTQIESPYFIPDMLEGTKWSLWFYPMGRYDDNYVSIELYRDKDCTGPHAMIVNSEISLLDDKVSFFSELLLNRTFTKGSSYFVSEKRKKVFVRGKASFLPDDVLTVQCRIWKINKLNLNYQYLYAQTRFNVKSKSFVWKLESFSTLPSSIRSKFRDNLIDFEVVLKERKNLEKYLVINGNSYNDSVKYFSFRIAVINLEGNEEYCVSKEFSTNDIKKGIYSILLSSQMLKEKKSRYLQNDTLTLDCKYIYSTGDISDCFYDSGTISTKLTDSVVKEKREEVQQPSTQVLPVLVNDLKTMYSEGIFSDMELRTSTKNFPAHKNILSARSSVFRRMFSNDMLEKNCGYIDIADLEADTVHRMLLYMYTDSLDGMKLENASKLYTAADKYDISTLKSKCSSFLKENLCPTNVCDILALSDLHQDDDLKNAVHDFIINHDKEVFNSQEWKHFMTIHIQLAADVMYKKVSLG